MGHWVPPRRATTMPGTEARAGSRVRARTSSAMSPASIMSAGSIRSRTHELISVSTYPGEMAVALTPPAHPGARWILATARRAMEARWASDGPS
jgi:hypothetical protein